MIVSIQNAEQGNSGIGWSTYTLGKDNDRDGAKLILGDTQLGDAICESINYKSGNYVRFVISFTDEDNVTTEQGREIVKEWFKEYMHGFRDDEFHLDIIEHQNTSHLHYHGRIAKKNLLTNTQLKPYYHQVDLDYKIAVNEVIAEKYNLTLGTDQKRLVLPPQEKEKRITEWRKEHGQEPYDLSSKKGRAVAEEGIADLISDLNTQGLVNSLDDVKAELTAMDFIIANEGYDKGKGFHYLTIEQDDKRLRLKGDIYGEQFYEHSREDRAKAISNNRGIRSGDKGYRRCRAEVTETLRKERTKRLKWIDRQYGNARKRAIQRIQEIKRFTEAKLYQNKKDALNLSSPSYSVDGNSHRTVDNVLHQVNYGNIDKSRKLQQHFSNVKPTQFVSDGSDYQEKRRLYNDRIRAKAIRRIRSIRKAKRAREEHIRAELQDDSKKYNREVPTIDERDIRVKQGRTASLNSLITGIRQTAESDYRAIKEATEERAIQRGNSEDFATSISIIRRSVGQFFERIKQEFAGRAKNLIIGVGNVLKKRMFLETQKKNVVSQLRSMNLNIKLRR